jgi:hypothetical protein
MAKKREFKKLKESMGRTSTGDKPTNPKLYAQVKAEAKRKFTKWPSAYGSSWLVKRYKEKGGGYA